VTTATRTELDGGFTLIEILVAVAILGITFTALLTGLATIMSGTDTHRKGSVSGTLLRQWAENIEALAPITSCSAVPNQYAFATVGPAVPAGYTTTAPTVTYWNGSSFVAGCTIGVEQRVVISVKSIKAGDVAQSLTIVKLQS